MLILLTSDTHYFNDNLERILEKYKNKMDLYIHCGDSSLEADHCLMRLFDYAVLGNHDEYPYPIYQIHQNILITHGHKYKIYKGYDNLIELCKTNNIQFCFHGHTHVPTHQIHDQIVFINPGSLMMNRGSYGFGTYAIINIEDTHYTVEFHHHETDEIVSHHVLSEGLEILEEFKKIAINDK